MVEKKFRVVLSNFAIDKLRSIHGNYKIKHSTELANKIKEGLIIESKKLKSLPESKPKLNTKKKISL